MNVSGIIGSFGFESCNGTMMPVTTELYISILNKFLEELGRAGDDDQGSWWFQQDGAGPRALNLTLV